MDKNDYLRVVQEKSDKRARVTGDAEIKRVAVILGDKLSNDPHWAKFQQEAGRQIDIAQARIDSYKLVLLDESTTSAEELTRAKIGFHAHQMAVDAFKLMLEFPTKFKVDEED